MKEMHPWHRCKQRTRPKNHKKLRAPLRLLELVLPPAVAAPSGVESMLVIAQPEAPVKPAGHEAVCGDSPLYGGS